MAGLKIDGFDVPVGGSLVYMSGTCEGVVYKEPYEGKGPGSWLVYVGQKTLTAEIRYFGPADLPKDKEADEPTFLEEGKVYTFALVAENNQYGMAKNPKYTYRGHADGREMPRAAAASSKPGTAAPASSGGVKTGPPPTV